MSRKQLFPLPCPRGQPFTRPREKDSSAGAAVCFLPSAVRERASEQGQEAPVLGKEALGSGWAEPARTAAATLHLTRGYGTRVTDTGILLLGQELNTPQTCRFLVLTADPQNPNFRAGAQESICWTGVSCTEGQRGDQRPRGRSSDLWGRDCNGRQGVSINRSLPLASSNSFPLITLTGMGSPFYS